MGTRYILTEYDERAGETGASTYTSLRKLAKAVSGIVLEDVRDFVASVEEEGREKMDGDYENATEFLDMLEGRTTLNFDDLKDMLDAWRDTDPSASAEIFMERK